MSVGRAAGALKRKLGAGESVAGVMLAANSPVIVELLGIAGFDFALIDMQHTPITLREAEELVRAAQVVGLSTLVRVPTIGEVDILKALDIGADGVLLPFVRSGADVRDAVSAAYYHPQGRRSICSQTRAANYGASLGGYAQRLSEMNRYMVLVGVIEDGEGLANIPDILAIEPGLDAIAIGRGDLANSLGVAGNQSDPRLLQTVNDAVASIKTAISRRESPCALGVFTYAQEEIDRWRGQGATFFCHMSEISLLANEAKRYLSTLHAQA